MVCVNCGSEAHRTGDSRCKNYCTLCAQSGHRQKIGSCPYRVCKTCGATGHSARECPSKTISKTIVNSCTEEAQMQHDRPSDEVCSANVTRNMATTRHNVRNQDAEPEYAAARTIETLAASHALSISARNAKARWIPKGTIRTIAPRY